MSESDLYLLNCRLCFSEEDEEEEEEVEKNEKESATSEPGHQAAVDGESKKKRKNDSMELVEYSPDELRSVDKEMLNAEITQLEGGSQV